MEIGPTALAFEAWAKAGLEAPNLEAMRQYRLQRIVGELRKHDYAGLLCFDPLNIRYVTDTTNMQLWVTHNPSRACFVSADGYVVLWDYANCGHLSAHLPLVRRYALARPSSISSRASVLANMRPGLPRKSTTC
ncbi:MAG: hypothetical protein R3D29_03465 [Nitratireductor sp.]